MYRFEIFPADIYHSVKQFNCKYISVYLDFKYLQCDALSNMITTYCLDAYASQLWDHEDKHIEKYYVAWKKANITKALRSGDQNLLSVKKTRIKIEDSSFAVAASVLWNALPCQIKKARTIDCFKSMIKTHLFKL